MTDSRFSPVDAGDGGFWRLRHDDLAALLARRDLNGEQLRVYLALADLTQGYQHEQDTVSLSQIGQLAGGMRRPHVVRALAALATKGLYGQVPTKGQSVIRWVVWPPPSVPEGGNTTVPEAGSSTVPKAVPTAGTHQDSKKVKNRKKNALASGAPRDPFLGNTLPAALDDPVFKEAWLEWVADRRERGKRLTGRAVKLQLSKLENCTPREAAATIRESIGNGWAGLFPKPSGSTARSSKSSCTYTPAAAPAGTDYTAGERRF